VTHADPFQSVLSAVGLRRSFAEVTAVDGVSFEVRPGEIVGLVGPNGAGKTTIINMILGVLEPTAGYVRIAGIDLARSRSQALAHTNFAAAHVPLPGNLTVEQNLRVFGLIYGVTGLSARIETLPRRRLGLRLNIPGRATFFGDGVTGYTDHPLLMSAERGAG
jgi:ABC-2 type transport system ATP-binding protein